MIKVIQAGIKNNITKKENIPSKPPLKSPSTILAVFLYKSVSESTEVVDIIKLNHVKGYETLRSCFWQHAEKHFLIEVGPNVQMVIIGMMTIAGYLIDNLKACFGPNVKIRQVRP